jgi:inner membrane protein import complex subunit Tim44-like protein
LMHTTDETPPPHTPNVPLARIARVDPDFSAVLFEDFAFRLYAAAHVARGAGRLDELSPYVSEAARQSLTARTPAGPVTGVVVGAMHTRDLFVPRVDGNRPDAFVRVVLEFEANYSVGTGEGSRRFVVEEWVFRRAASARTRPPEPARRFPCPNCGAPWRTESASGTQKCASCGAVVDNGRFDWEVAEIHLRHDRGSVPGLSEEVPERGTSLPTRKDRQFAADWAALMQDDPGVTALAIETRLTHIYAVVNDAWTRQELADARAVLSDGLADYFQYWLDAYGDQGLRNVLEDMRITRHELVKLRRDRYYDALTVRLWATGKDYVIRTSDNTHVRGSQSDERPYSEYWTLIRAAGPRGAPPPEATCGGCGAPLVVSMAGACSHCGAHVTAGEFDWVLSKIEQDDSYAG